MNYWYDYLLQIEKREIDFPERFKIIDVSQLEDNYPPKLYISAAVIPSKDSKVKVDGLDRKCDFHLHLPGEALQQPLPAANSKWDSKFLGGNNQLSNYS